MLRFSTRQRVVLGQTLLELANFAAAALVFGQFVGEGAVSWELIIAGAAFWPVFSLVGTGCRRRVAMENALWMLGALTLAASIFVLIDWLGRRKGRQSRNRAA